MKTPKTLSKQLIEKFKQKSIFSKYGRTAREANKKVYNFHDLYAGKILKVEKDDNLDKIIVTPVQEFALFLSIPYYVNFRTGLELEPFKYNQINNYVIDELKPLKEACPDFFDIFDINENKKFSKNEIIEIEEAIIEEFYTNQNSIPRKL